MFIQRKKVALLLLIFIAIPITIAFSAFKLSASKAAIAADENKTEYTLSDFGVAVPDDGIDFSSTNHGESKPLKLITKTYSSLNFSFSLQLNENVQTSGKLIYFRLTTIRCLKFEFKSSDFTATLVERDENEKEDKNAEVIIKTTDCFKDCKADDLIVFKIVVVAKENISLQVSCGNKDCEGNIKYSATINKLLLWSKGLKSAKLYNADANIKSTTLTVKNESGDIVSPVDTKALTHSEIVKAVETEQKKFIGFEYESKLYKTADEIETIDKNAVVTAKTMTLYMEYGARIRTIEPFGIRFAAVASYSAADYGIMLTTKDIAKNSDSFTLENLEATGAKVKIANKKQTQKEFREVRDDNKGLSNFAIALIVKEYNYNRVFASRAFAKIEYCNGETKTIYSDFSEDNCRSIYDVAKVGLEKDKSHHELYRKYCNGVIDIKIEGKNISLLYTSNLYTVNFSEEGTQLILTLEPNKECAIPKNICISINGERVEFEGVGGKIFKVDLSKISS